MGCPSTADHGLIGDLPPGQEIAAVRKPGGRRAIFGPRAPVRALGPSVTGRHRSRSLTYRVTTRPHGISV
jgi:hypothetical protein